MKKIIFIISIVLLFSIATFAQTSGENQVKWKQYSLTSEEFSVEAPENLAAFSYDRRNEMRRYSGTTDKAFYFIFSEKLGSNPQATLQFDTALEFVKIYRKTELEDQKNSKQMKFSFSDEEDFYHTIYAVKTKKRAYVFHLVSEKKDDPNVKRFFQSLKVNGNSVGNVFESANAETPAQNKTPEPIGIGVGDGSGRGSGIVNNPSISPPNDQNKSFENKDLTITYKPKPRYNDFARFYGIIGNVRVKTTFLADASIGTVTALSKLPFGLTKEAIETAKKMRFNPKTVNGQPVAVTKVVVFNFTIY